MENNLFEELQAKKVKLLEMAEKAHEFGWIKKEASTDNSNGQKNIISLQEIKEKLEKDTLTIGVIGQIKAGKSTFLNSFVFENEVLPAATTPMTAALSVITYGEKERILAEFYTEDEWAEQKMVAQMDEYETSSNVGDSKIKAAKELVSKSVILGNSINEYLGKTKEDSFENLKEYVGAEGKYVSITKSVTIYYPKEYLKGVEIVDTPGFNDPIVSREERTKEFLKKADVVIMMIYIDRAFDTTDKNIIFKDVRQCGIGKVIVAINKYDVPYSDPNNPQKEDEIKNYVKEKIRKASKESNDSTLTEILKEVEPINISAEMALLSKLPMSKIQNTDNFNFAYNRYCEMFEISSQKELYEKSHIEDLANTVKSIIEKEKNQILLVKPLNSILAAGISRKEELEKDLVLKNTNISLLKMSDTDIDEKERKLEKVHKRVSRKINSLGEDMESTIQNIIRKGANDLEDIVEASCNRMKSIVKNDLGIFSSVDKIIPSLDSEEIKLEKKLKRETESIANDIKTKLIYDIDSFLVEIGDIVVDHIDEDFEAIDYIKGFKSKIDLQIEEDNLFEDSDDDEDSDDEVKFIHVLAGILNPIGTIYSAIYSDYIDTKKGLEDYINSINSDFKGKEYLSRALARVDEIKATVKTAIIDEFLDKMQEQINEVRAKKEDREKNLKEAEEKKKELELLKAKTETELENISSYKALIQ